jgi:hypothetical protein
MTEETQETYRMGEQKDDPNMANEALENEGLTPEVVTDGAPSNEPELFKFFSEIKANPRNFTNQQIIDRIFEIAKIDAWECWDARLQQTAATKFNLVQIAFQAISRSLLARHGIQPQVQQQTVELPKPAEEKKLVTLS